MLKFFNIGPKKRKTHQPSNPNTYNNAQYLPTRHELEQPLINPNYHEAFKRFGDSLPNLSQQKYFNNRSLAHLQNRSTPNLRFLNEQHSYKPVKPRKTQRSHPLRYLNLIPSKTN